MINHKGLKTLINKDFFLESIRLYALFPMDIQDIFLAILVKNNDSIVITFNKKDFKKLKAGSFVGP